MGNWGALTDELDRWAGAGRVATLWWRDDDAAAPAPALDRLLAARARLGVPLALAVVPASAEEAAADAIGADREATVLQHGYAHRNHAGSGERKAELGEGRPAADSLADIASGRRRLETLFGARLAPILVPPWNRIAEALVAGLSDAGYTGFSAYGPRRHARPAPGLAQVNTHIDPIDWRGSRGFVGEAAALDLAIGHLRARRTGAADGDEPTGLLSHHLVHDAAAWRFIQALVAATRAHPAARWIGVRDAFATALAT